MCTLINNLYNSNDAETKSRQFRASFKEKLKKKNNLNIF